MLSPDYLGDMSTAIAETAREHIDPRGVRFFSRFNQRDSLSRLFELGVGVTFCAAWKLPIESLDDAGAVDVSSA